MRKKKGQISIGFHWIYILIAGAIILIFFVGIALKQKDVSEQSISATVIQSLESIFTGAGLAEQTINYIEIPELEIAFTCDLEGYSDYSVGSVKTETPFQPIFALERVKDNVLVTWTLEWMMPFKVDNYMFVMTPDIRYYLIYDTSSRPLASEIEAALPTEISENINFESLDISEYFGIIDKNDYKVRFVFLSDTAFVSSIPLELQGMADRDVTAMVLSGTLNGGTISFYRKDGSGWMLTGSSPLIGSFTDDNPNFYGAVFSEGKEQYDCNLRKAFKRLKISSEIYLERALQLEPASIPDCHGIFFPDYFTNSQTGLIARAEQCSEKIEVQCDLKPNVGDQIFENNRLLGTAGCFDIY
ncbi:hypothetical protein ACFLZB_01650 [Nanoarchaeota archaeon]